MDNGFELNEHPLIAFVPTRDPDRARAFYRDLLGLRLISEQLPFALVFDARGVVLRVTVVKELTPPPYTALGWEVPNIEDAVASLTADRAPCRNIRRRYSLPRLLMPSSTEN